MIRAVLLSLCLCIAGAVASADVLRLAVTTSFENSGLADVILPAIQADTGIDVQLLVVGTGQAIRLGQSGDVDAILVHSRQAENDFVADGFGTHRREIMYNDFVIVGPAADPANVMHATTAIEAMARLANANHPFISRGDESGTHKAEVALWHAAAVDIATFGHWYRPVGAGMGAALNTASAMDAYVLSDRASWLKFGNKGGLKILFQGDPALFNQYAFIPVNQMRHPHVRNDLAATLEQWLSSPTAETLINSYKIDGTNLFTFNALPLLR